MLAIHPRRLQGRWREGFALDLHTESSVYVGDNEFGHPKFSTTRTEVGELLYKLKSLGDISGIQEMVDTATRFVKDQKWPLEVLVSVPPSRDRSLQPVILLADRIAEQLGIPHDRDAIEKLRSTPELKNIYDFDERTRILKGSFQTQTNRFEGQRVLLFDDLYRSGATMNSVAEILYDQERAADVYTLTITRTRVRS